MASIKMSENTCARCPRHLAISNKNIFGLCGYCQRSMSAKGLREWNENGKPRVGHTSPPPRKARKAPRRLPCDLHKLSDAVLVALVKAAHEEVATRATGARKLLALLEG